MALEMPQFDTTQRSETYEVHHGAPRNDLTAGCTVSSRPQTMPQLVLFPGNWQMSRLPKGLLGLFVFFRERGDGSIGPPMQGENFHGPDDTFREMVSMFTALLNTHIFVQFVQFGFIPQNSADEEWSSPATAET